MAEGARQARPAGRRFAAEYPPPTGEDVELACYGIQYRRQRDGDGGARGGEAAVVHRPVDAGGLRAAVRRADREGRSHAGRSPRALPPRDGSGQRPPRAGDRGDLPSGRAHHGRASSRTSSAEPGGARSRKGDFRVEAAGRARSRALRARARRAQRRRRRSRRMGEAARPAARADRLYGNARLAYHAARQLVPLAATVVPRDRGGGAFGSAARVARPCRAAGRCVARRAGRDRRDAAGRGRRIPRGATGRRARCRPPDAARRRPPSTPRWPGNSVSTGCFRRRRWASASSRSSTRARSRTPMRWQAFGARAAVRRVVKLAQLDMRTDALREWVYVVRGLPDEGAAARRRLRAPAGTLRPCDQHRRAHVGAPRFRPALPDAVPRAFRGGGARARRRRGAAPRHRAPGIALRPGHRVVGRRGRPDAADAADRALGGEAAGRHRLSARRRSATSAINTQFGAFYFKYWLDRLDAHAGARGGRVQCGAGPRAGVAQRRAARRRDLGRDDPVQRDPRLREEGARQRDVLRAGARAAVRPAAARGSARCRRAATAPTRRVAAAGG